MFAEAGLEKNLRRFREWYIVTYAFYKQLRSMRGERESSETG